MSSVFSIGDMKYLLIFLALQLVIAGRPPKQLYLTVKILPALREAAKMQKVNIEVTSSMFSFQSVLNVADSLPLVFEMKSDSEVVVRLAGLVTYADGSERFFINASRFPINGQALKTTINFPEDCEVNLYTGGKSCPRCKQYKEVIPIFYGLPAPDMQGQPGIDFQPAGCVRSTCSPAWYCRKDSVEF